MRYCSSRPGPWRPLLPSGRASPLRLRQCQAPLGPLTAWGQGRGPALTACCSLGLRMGFAWSSLGLRYGLRGFCGFPASSVPRCLPQAAHHSPPYYRDAAAFEQVTAHLRRAFLLRPFKGVPGNPLLSRAPTFQMKRCFPARAPAQIRYDFSPGEVYCSGHITGILAETKARNARRANGSPGSRRRTGGIIDRHPAGRGGHRGEDH